MGPRRGPEINGILGWAPKWAWSGPEARVVLGQVRWGAGMGLARA
jgi:hypothetical protein